MLLVHLILLDNKFQQVVISMLANHGHILDGVHLMLLMDLLEKMLGILFQLPPQLTLLQPLNQQLPPHQPLQQPPLNQLQQPPPLNQQPPQPQLQPPPLNQFQLQLMLPELLTLLDN